MIRQQGSRRLPAYFVSRVRAAVGAYMVLLGLSGDDHFDWYPEAAWTLVLVAFAYAVGVLVFLARPGRKPLPGWTSWVMCAVDTTIIATLAGLTGGADSPFAPVLLLVLIAIAIRSNLRRGLAALSWTAPLLAVLILAVPEPSRPAGDRVRDALWWTGHLTAAAVLAGVLSDRLDLAQRRRTQAESEAEAEHRRLEMERLLRRRLEDLDDARREFLTALLHEFRPSVSSLSTLSRALRRDEHDLDPEERAGMLVRMDGSAHHLDTVLREVADVLVSESLDSRHRGDLADVYLPQLVGTAATMAGLSPDRLVTRCEPGVSLVRADSDRCLRILVKVLEEAARTSPGTEAVEVAVSRAGELAEIVVLDRRPTPGDGSARRDPPAGPPVSLGLWLASRLAEGMGGSLVAESRVEDGLAVRVRFPVATAAVPARHRS